MSKKIILLCIIVSTSLVNAGHSSESLGYKQGELLVRFAPKSDGKHRTMMEHNQILAAINGGTILRSSKFVPGLSVVKLPENITVENALVSFKDANGILNAQPNYIYKALSTFPNDTYGPKPAPDGGNQWALHNIGQTGGTSDADIDAPEAWDIHTGGNEIIVAVIDTGVDYTHPDLAANMWVNQTEV